MRHRARAQRTRPHDLERTAAARCTEISRRFVDDTKVTDHHAIIPTPVAPEGVRLGPDEQRIYDLVCRRVLQAWREGDMSDVLGRTLVDTAAVDS